MSPGWHPLLEILDSVRDGATPIFRAASERLGSVEAAFRELMGLEQRSPISGEFGELGLLAFLLAEVAET
jgi:hypothetical protein